MDAGDGRIDPGSRAVFAARYGAGVGLFIAL